MEDFFLPPESWGPKPGGALHTGRVLLGKTRDLFGCIAAAPSPAAPVPPKHTQAHSGNITFLKFSLQFNLCLEYFQAKQRESLKAGTRLGYGARQAPSGCGQGWGTSITSRLRTASPGQPGLTPSLLPLRVDENRGWGRAVGTVRGAPLFTHKRRNDTSRG